MANGARIKLMYTLPVRGESIHALLNEADITLDNRSSTKICNPTLLTNCVFVSPLLWVLVWRSCVAPLCCAHNDGNN